MKPELGDAVHEIAQDLVNASSAGDTQAQWAAYQQLANLCERSEHEGRNHPFQWETLGDFTPDSARAIAFYEKALGYARALQLQDYVASVSLAMAEALLDSGSIAQARDFAVQANEAAVKSDDLELRKNISELLLRLSERN